LHGAINGNTMAEVDETCPTAPPALSANEIEARRAEVLVVGEDGQPLPGGGLKRMLSDMAMSGVWDVESDDDPIEPRLIP
jgi:hypothetical protein